MELVYLELAAASTLAKGRPKDVQRHLVQKHLVRDLLRSSEATSSLKPDDFITVILNLAHGLAATQRILGAELSKKSTRILIQSLFDHLISSA
jgi:hypothetical protein